MTKRRPYFLLLTAAVLMILPTRSEAQNCGPFTDVAASDAFCPFILQAFFTSVTQGTSATTFSPTNVLTRAQGVVFFDKVLDQGLHRGSLRTIIGKTWAPTSVNGSILADVGGAVNDIVSDGTYLWIARGDGKILKVNAADRKMIETWNPQANLPKRLGIFGGQVWAVDNQGNLQVFNPSQTAGSTTVFGPTGIPAGDHPSLAFDGVNLWLGNSQSHNLTVISPVTLAGTAFTQPGNIDGLVFDGTFMWVLLSNSTLLKLTAPASGQPSVVETFTIPGGVADCHMVFDGNNIWIPIGPQNMVAVVRPTVGDPAVLPSVIVKMESIPDLSFPYAASFDGENVIIGGVNNGFVALYKASSLTRIRTINTGLASIRSIAADGSTVNIGDASGTKFLQF